MNVKGALRWSGAHWFLPALFATSCFIGAQVTIRTGYPTADFASTGLALNFAGPITAGFVAAKFRLFPRFSRPLRSRRSGAAITVAAWWPLLLGAPLVLCLSVVITARDLPTDDSAWTLLLIDFLTALACALTGLGFAWALPAVVAIPTVSVMWFFWLTYGPSSDHEVLHNMSSTFAACCTSQTAPATVALHASLTVTGVVCLGIVLLLMPTQWARRSRLLVAPAIAAVLVAGVGAGALVATASSRELTLQAVQPRSGTPECHTSQQIRVCLWPEDSDRVDELAGIAVHTNATLNRLGLDELTHVTQGEDPGAATIAAGAHLDHDDLRYTIAAGYVDRASRCVGASGAARDELVALVSLAAGLTESDLDVRFPPAAVAAATDQLSRATAAPADVAAWFAEDLNRVSCAEHP